MFSRNRRVGPVKKIQPGTHLLTLYSNDKEDYGSSLDHAGPFHYPGGTTFLAYEECCCEDVTAEINLLRRKRQCVVHIFHVH